jgi:hypothetical protein
MKGFPAADKRKQEQVRTEYPLAMMLAKRSHFLTGMLFFSGTGVLPVISPQG